MAANLYDTNILIDAKRNQSPLFGFTTILNIIEFPKALENDGLNVLQPGSNDYEVALELSIKLLEVGTPVPAVDVIVAAMCLKRNLVLHTSDRHFKEVKAIAKTLKLRLES